MKTFNYINIDFLVGTLPRTLHGFWILITIQICFALMTVIPLHPTKFLLDLVLHIFNNVIYVIEFRIQLH